MGVEPNYRIDNFHELWSYPDGSSEWLTRLVVTAELKTAFGPFTVITKGVMSVRDLRKPLRRRNLCHSLIATAPAWLTLSNPLLSAWFIYWDAPSRLFRSGQEIVMLPDRHWLNSLNSRYRGDQELVTTRVMDWQRRRLINALAHIE